MMSESEKRAEASSPVHLRVKPEDAPETPPERKLIGTRAILPGRAFKLRDGAIYANDAKGTLRRLNPKKYRGVKTRIRRKLRNAEAAGL